MLAATASLLFSWTATLSGRHILVEADLAAARRGLGAVDVVPHPRAPAPSHPRTLAQLPVTDTVPAPLAGWESFYVIVGSSAAALTGLQFVVIALINDLHTRATDDTLGAFGTPTVVHFCVALLVAAILSAPWAGLASPAIALGVTGLAGLLYAAIVIRRARRQKGYHPVLEDWMFHAVLPVVAYASIVGGAVDLVTHTGGALFAIAAATLLLVFIGIHNAWDTVTWITLVAKNRDESGNAAEGAPAGDGASAAGAAGAPAREPERAETR